MSLARLKRIARLEARKPRGRPHVDCSPWAVPFFAVLEGRPHSVLPRPEVELTEEQETALRLRMRELDVIHDRLEAGDPGGAERFQKERAGRLAATIRRLEAEHAGREGRQCAEPEVAQVHGLPE